MVMISSFQQQVDEADTLTSSLTMVDEVKKALTVREMTEGTLPTEHMSSSDDEASGDNSMGAGTPMIAAGLYLEKEEKDEEKQGMTIAEDLRRAQLFLEAQQDQFLEAQQDQLMVAATPKGNDESHDCYEYNDDTAGMGGDDHETLIADFESRLAAQDEIIADLRSEMGAKDKKIASLESEMAAQEDQLAVKEKRIQELLAQMEELKKQQLPPRSTSTQKQKNQMLLKQLLKKEQPEDSLSPTGSSHSISSEAGNAVYKTIEERLAAVKATVERVGMQQAHLVQRESSQEDIKSRISQLKEKLAQRRTTTTLLLRSVERRNSMGAIERRPSNTTPAIAAAWVSSGSPSAGSDLRRKTKKSSSTGQLSLAKQSFPDSEPRRSSTGSYPYQRSSTVEPILEEGSKSDMSVGSSKTDLQEEEGDPGSTKPKVIKRNVSGGPPPFNHLGLLGNAISTTATAAAAEIEDLLGGNDSDTSLLRLGGNDSDASLLSSDLEQKKPQRKKSPPPPLPKQQHENRPPQRSRTPPATQMPARNSQRRMSDGDYLRGRPVSRPKLLRKTSSDTDVTRQTPKSMLINYSQRKKSPPSPQNRPLQRSRTPPPTTPPARNSQRRMSDGEHLRGRAVSRPKLLRKTSSDTDVTRQTPKSLLINYSQRKKSPSSPQNRPLQRSRTPPPTTPPARSRSPRRSSDNGHLRAMSRPKLLRKTSSASNVTTATSTSLLINYSQRRANDVVPLRRRRSSSLESVRSASTTDCSASPCTRYNNRSLLTPSRSALSIYSNSRNGDSASEDASMQWEALIVQQQQAADLKQQQSKNTNYSGEDDVRSCPPIRRTNTVPVTKPPIQQESDDEKLGGGSLNEFLERRGENKSDPFGFKKKKKKKKKKKRGSQKEDYDSRSLGDLSYYYKKDDKKRRGRRPRQPAEDDSQSRRELFKSQSLRENNPAQEEDDNLLGIRRHNTVSGAFAPSSLPKKQPSRSSIISTASTIPQEVEEMLGGSLSAFLEQREQKKDDPFSFRKKPRKKRGSNRSSMNSSCNDAVSLPGGLSSFYQEAYEDNKNKHQRRSHGDQDRGHTRGRERQRQHDVIPRPSQTDFHMSWVAGGSTPMDTAPASKWSKSYSSRHIPNTWERSRSNTPTRRQQYRRGSGDRNHRASDPSHADAQRSSFDDISTFATFATKSRIKRHGGGKNSSRARSISPMRTAKT